MLVRVIVAIDDPVLRDRAVRLLEDPAVHVLSAASRRAAESALVSQAYDLAIVASEVADEKLERLLSRMAGLPDAPQLIALLSNDASEGRAQLAAAGAMAVLDAMLPDALLGPALVGLVAARQVEARGPRQDHAAHGVPRFIFESKAARAVVDTIQRIASANSSVLLLGQTGVGKEHVAEMIHQQSARASGPFVPVNCGAIPTELFESELFGHERGAFTGAHRARRGVFELAHGGTLFLDEVAEVPPHLQVKLLRTLQERSIRPLGSESLVEIDVRVVAATNQDLAAAMAAGTFRRDLYYRLSVVELEVPALRDRPEDVLAMAEAFVERFRLQLGRPVIGFEDEALQAVRRYDWPGNVRELLNAIERAVLLCEGPLIRLIDLPASVAACSALDEPSLAAFASGPAAGAPELAELVQLPPRWAHESWRVVREGILLAGERAYLTALLTATEGRVGDAATRAGISARALFDKMRRHGLRKESFRRSV